MAKKKSVLIYISNDETIKIYICLDGIKEISSTIFKESSKEKKFKMIIESIFRRSSNRSLYEKYSDYPGTSVIKLSKGKENLRIYCKLERINDSENNPIQHITLVKIHHKKNQTLSKKEVNILQAIQNNDYEYKKWS